ncbi:14236_t:CDS:2 [Ambispora leptoticha]|uniref:14236_t:CDS:1 n=1 Tax=Ambispora leptoticha TaxID=144679 RepID=A0A9N9FG61_9GLOM|nr:14236_t:CDS:2 [Ambispora leptoticha]
MAQVEEVEDVKALKIHNINLSLSETKSPISPRDSIASSLSLPPPPLPPKEDDDQSPTPPPKDKPRTRITFSGAEAIGHSLSKNSSVAPITTTTTTKRKTTGSLSFENLNAAYTFPGSKKRQNASSSSSASLHPPPPQQIFESLFTQQQEPTRTNNTATSDFNHEKRKLAGREMRTKLSHWLSLSKFRKSKHESTKSEETIVVEGVESDSEAQNIAVQSLELSISSRTLFPEDDDESPFSTMESTTATTAATTMESIINKKQQHERDDYFGIDVDSIAKYSEYSSERTDDDTIKNVSGTISTHTSSMFIRDNSNRSTIVGRDNSNRSTITNNATIPASSSSLSKSTPLEISKIKNTNTNLNPLLNIPRRKDSLLLRKENSDQNNDSSNSKSNQENAAKIRIEPNLEVISESSAAATIANGNNNNNITTLATTNETNEHSKHDKSPLKLFTKKLVQSFRPSHSSIHDEKSQKSNIATSKESTPLDVSSSPTLEIGILEDVDIHTLDDGAEGDVSATQSQAQESSLYTASEFEPSSPKKSLSRMSSFAKSFNSENPSALSTTFSDSQFAESEMSRADWPVESAWDALVNIAESDKGPARLSNNHLSYIPSHFFDGLHNLKALYLDRNSLRDLPEELLKLTKLEILDLSNNCISEFHPRLKFKRLRNLRRLNLDNNGLLDITSMTKLKTLRELRVNNNYLDNLSPDIGRLVKLKLLYLNNNDLTSLPDAIGRLRSLSVLRLNNNHILNLPASICALRQLQILELRGNLLSQLPENLKDLENLTQFDISENKLSQLPNDIIRCTKLVKLDVHSNLLESIPLKIGQLSRLVNFNLSENRLSTLPADIGKLTALIDLDVSNNRLVVLPEELGKLVKLTEIKLNNNPSLLTIPESLKKLPLIKKIYLQNCSLSQISFELGLAYKKLTFLDLSSNALEVIPKLDGLDKLVILKISNNRISDLSEQIEQLESLRELYASKNQLKRIPKSIGRLKNLEILEISDNLLADLPLSIGDCHALREIRLSGNSSLMNLPTTLGRLNLLNIFHVGEWPAFGFTVTQDDNRTNNANHIKISPYQQKVPQHVERTLLWRMHDSILKRLRELDNDLISESLTGGTESLNASQQDVTNSHPPSPIPSQSPSPPVTLLQRDDMILKMAVLKSVYDQIIRDMRPLESDKDSSGDDATEFPDESGKKKKFKKLKDFKFLNRGEK